MSGLMSSAGRTVFWWVLIGALAIVSIFVIIKLFYEPQWKRGYDNQVVGLVTTYCSATAQDAREASRQDLIGQRDSASDKWAALDARQRARAEAVIRKDADACK
jgi:hypothetical protein